MSTTAQPADQSERERALDPSHSFIIQAPAGSGKTELLTQRVLVLLARVRQPEEVVAITFTRKAAAEMRARILKAIREARVDDPPTVSHEWRTWELAQAVTARDDALGWHIEANPSRLRVQTIDSLCASLTRQMPLLSRFGGQPKITENPEPLYLEAALRTLAGIESEESWSADIEKLLDHLDNDLNRVAELIASMLRRRDHWVRHVVGNNERLQLEQALVHLIEDGLAQALKRFPEEAQREVVSLAQFAAQSLRETGEQSPLLACIEPQELTSTNSDKLTYWLGLVELLLTRQGDWRRRFSKREGFPAAATTKDKEEKRRLQEMKKRATALVQQLSEISGLQAALVRLRELPEAGYTNAQWQILEALISLLRIALAQQELVFQERGEVDFTAISQAALQALGKADEPTDLALSLDYRIQHLLIDEFQDTSLSQYQLLEQLTAGWQPNEGRTLFCVGDPMQSIYRFREAEVGLYLRARRYGIGDLSLIPLTLSVNFRSEKGIVEWVNRCFEQVLPKQEDVATGAVSYSPALAIHLGEADNTVQVHPCLGNDRLAEAEQVATLVIQAQQQRPSERCAILVRSRSHLTEIVPQLRAQGLRFRAVEIESMGSRQVVLDLLSLTLALNHPADRIAWLSVLRAPWCGLTLHDLHVLCTDQPKATIPELLQHRSNLKGLSDDGQRRLVRVADILLLGLEQRQRCSLRRWVESAWLALGGPAVVTQARDLEATEAFLGMLDDVDQGAGLSDREALEKQVATLYAPTDPEADEGLQLMTIHKAKGLEFDTVIVPGLGRRPKADDQRLLMWIDWPREQGSSELLLAPIKGSGEENNKAYTCISGLDREKARFEDGRLLYVAATRARRYLHLLGHVNSYVRDGRIKTAQPARGSLLAQIWPVVEQEFQHLVANRQPEALQHVPATEMHENRFQRLPSSWRCPSPPPPLKLPGNPIPEARREEQLEFDWAAPTARIVGTVVHSLLQLLPGWRAHRPGQESKKIKRFAHSALLQHGLHGLDLEQTLGRVERVFDNMLSDTRGLWITDPNHHDAHNEYPLSGFINGRILNLVIDRCFVDTDGVRWIIDYKSSSHEGGGLQEFLDREKARYKPQLDRYGQLFALKDPRPIRLGLYYPLLQGWREWGLGD